MGNQQTGEVWNKGNNFSILVFIQIKSKLKKSWNRPWKKINQFWKRSSQFSFTRQNEKIKTLYSSKKIYNTKYIDNRTMQRLHKWIVRLPFLILLFDVHSFHGGTIYFLYSNFSTKAVFSCKPVWYTKSGRPLLSIQQESYCPKHSVFSGVSNFSAFLIDFLANRPATLIFLRDRRG